MRRTRRGTQRNLVASCNSAGGTRRSRCVNIYLPPSFVHLRPACAVFPCAASLGPIVKLRVAERNEAVGCDVNAGPPACALLSAYPAGCQPPLDDGTGAATSVARKHCSRLERMIMTRRARQRLLQLCLLVRETSTGFILTYRKRCSGLVMGISCVFEFSTRR